MDDYDRCFALIDAQLRWTAGAENSSSRLVQAVLLQQKSLRLLDAGLAYAETSAMSLRLLAEFDVSSCAPFDVNTHNTASYKETLARIAAASRSAAYSLLRHGNWAGGQELEVLKALQTEIPAAEVHRLLEIDREKADTYSEFLSQLFEQRFRSTATWVIGGPRIPDLFRSTLALELIGHGYVYRARRELAQLRFVQASSEDGYGLLDDPVQLLGDAVRLLRHAAASKDLDLALRWLRAGGPLEGLSTDARRIVQMRRQRERLRVVELRVLQASADLLTRSEADLGLQAVFASLEAGGPLDLPRLQQLEVTRLETAWSTAASLANTAGRVDDAARLLLRELTSMLHEDQLRDYAIARALENLEWDQVGVELVERFQNWLAETRGMLPATSSVLSARLGPNIGAVANRALDIEIVAMRLNAAMRGFQLDDLFLREASNLVRRSMSEIRRSAEAQRSAAVRSYNISGSPVGDAAAGLILYGGTVGLWPDLADFLTDTAVQRADRSPAFERLAQEASVIPEEVRDRFRAEADAVLHAPDVALEPAIVPYPAALRFLGTCKLVDEIRALNLTTQLAGTAGDKGRQEAAQTVASMSRTTSSSWLLALAIQLSHDDDVEVRANAGMSLAQLSRSASSFTDLSGSRLVDLLRQDGLLVPVLVLRGLRGLPDGLLSDVRQQIEQMRENHPSRAVRGQAARLLRGDRDSQE